MAKSNLIKTYKMTHPQYAISDKVVYNFFKGSRDLKFCQNTGYLAYVLINQI